MHNERLVSIIIPVYNAQNYLNRCIDSLISQTYFNLEILLINDGSLDNSGLICDSYAKKDSRVKVFHQTNKGASEAKNRGLDLFTGEFVTFVDADDFVKETYIDRLLKLIVDYKADMVQCMYQTGSNSYFSPKLKENVKLMVLNDNEIFESKYYKSIVWGKLYHRKMFENVRFIPNRHIDDEGVSYKNYYLADRIVITTEQLYYYYQSPNSLMRNEKPVKLDFMATFEERLIYFKNLNEIGLYNLSIEKYSIVLMLKYISVYNNPHNSDEEAQMIFDRFNELYPVMITSKQTKLKHAIILSIFKFLPIVAIKVRNLAKIK